jgi:hypothetical protein
MATLTEAKKRPEQKPLPAPNSDFYQLAETLNAEELGLLRQVRAFMEAKVAPIINNGSQFAVARRRWRRRD